MQTNKDHLPLSDFFFLLLILMIRCSVCQSVPHNTKVTRTEEFFFLKKSEACVERKDLKLYSVLHHRLILTRERQVDDKVYIGIYVYTKLKFKDTQK